MCTIFGSLSPLRVTDLHLLLILGLVGVCHVPCLTEKFLTKRELFSLYVVWVEGISTFPFRSLGLE